MGIEKELNYVKMAIVVPKTHLLMNISDCAKSM